MPKKSKNLKQTMTKKKTSKSPSFRVMVEMRKIELLASTLPKFILERISKKSVNTNGYRSSPIRTFVSVTVTNLPLSLSA